MWVSSSKTWGSHEFCWSALFWLLLICIWSVAHSPSFPFFSAHPGRHSRSLLRSASWAILQAFLLNQHLPQLLGFFPSRLGGKILERILESQAYVHSLRCFAQEARVASSKVTVT